MAYLGSFWRRVREQNTKKPQRTEHAFAEIPEELAGVWMPTESGTGRLATGGKALVSSLGKMPTTSASADLQREEQCYYPSSMRTNLTGAYKYGFLSNELKRILSVNTPEPNQTFLSNLPLRNVFKEHKYHLRNIVRPELTLPPNICAASYAAEPTLNKKDYFDFLRVQYPTNGVSHKKYKRYEDEDHDQFTQYVENYTANSMLDLRN